MTWYVLTDGENYWGQLWENFNNSPRRPRHTMRALDDSVEFRPITCAGIDRARAEGRRALAIQGRHLRPVAVRFQGSGKNTRIEVIDSRNHGSSR
jgi:hypothetical protein